MEDEGFTEERKREVKRLEEKFNVRLPESVWHLLVLPSQEAAAEAFYRATRAPHERITEGELAIMAEVWTATTKDEIPAEDDREHVLGLRGFAERLVEGEQHSLETIRRLVAEVRRLRGLILGRQEHEDIADVDGGYSILIPEETQRRVTDAVLAFEAEAEAIRKEQLFGAGQ